MSRSRKKTPISGLTTARSEKEWKISKHRVLRRKNRIKTRLEQENVEEKEIFDPWDGPKDGKQYLGGKHPKLLRK